MRPRKRGRRLTMVVGVLLATASAMGLGGFLFVAEPAHGKRPALTPQTATQAALAREAPRAAPMAAVPEQVTVELVSLPLGAGVWIDGSRRGDTPLSVVLPRRTEPVTLRLQLDGHQALEQPLVPDVDQRLSLSLTPRTQAPDASAGENAFVGENGFVGENPSGRENASQRPKKSHKRVRASKQADETPEEFFLFE